MMTRDGGSYSWDISARRFRDPGGKFVSQTKIKAMKSSIVRRESEVAASLARDFVSGLISPEQFVRAMRTLVKRTTTMEYMLGRGGRYAMTQADYGRIGALLRQDYKRINDFATAIQNGMDVGPAEHRARLYIDHTRSAYERGQLAAWNITIDDRPPLHPNCQCSLAISHSGVGEKREIRVYWRVNSSNPCRVCLDNQSKYSPLRIPDPE